MAPGGRQRQARDRHARRRRRPLLAPFLLLLVLTLAGAVATVALGPPPADGRAWTDGPSTSASTTGVESALRARAAFAGEDASEESGGQSAAPPDPAALPARSGTGRRIVYSLSGQRVWLVGAAGHVQRSYLVSGRRGEPAPRGYRVYSRSVRARSAVSPETMRLMVRFTRGRRSGVPIGFHTIPRDRQGRPAQSVAELGQPLSHGCIRQRRVDAVALWEFAHVGTRVVVVR